MPQNFFASDTGAGAILRVDAALSIRRISTRDLCVDEDLRDEIPINRYSSIIIAKVSDWEQITDPT